MQSIDLDEAVSAHPVRKESPEGTIRLQHALGLKTASKWMHHRRERAKGWRRVCCHWLCVDSPFSEVPGDAALSSPWFQSLWHPYAKEGQFNVGSLRITLF